MKVFAKFITSAVDAAAFPPASVPEIAFLGRSNVGKSSLINSLLGTKAAHVSRTPGRTQTINFFELRRDPERASPDVMFVDLPGYGYARAPYELVSGWPKFIDPYLTQRESLALCICLVDISIPPQASDAQLQQFLQAQQRPILTVATKSDRLSGNKLQTALRDFAREMGSGNIVPYSSKTGAGRNELWREIRAAAFP